MLPSRVNIPVPANPTQEDFFSAGLGTLFSDDTQNSHGTPGESVVYTSPAYGRITLEIPRHPDVEEGRKLFAHYLWNAGVVAADAIEAASSNDRQEAKDGKVNWSERWDVRDRDVLELGAGTALPSLVAAFSGAKSVTITDHPSSPALVTDTIAHNVKANLHVYVRPTAKPDTEEQPRTKAKVSVHGLKWGTPKFMSPFSPGKASDPQPKQHGFDTMIIADCLWMPSQHVNIVRTIDQNLRLGNGQAVDKEACALVIAGYHTGRGTVARFFQIATGTMPQDVQETLTKEEGEEVREVQHLLRLDDIFEVDVDCNVRPWQEERAGECKDMAKRWVVCAVLVRKCGTGHACE
ncbi:hypothetical protein HIM_08830 [Hirsutella minnesotensis 3608]|uniref:Protein N-terminal and lysine N-methyltransferase EFM7 n=1 Tax=Hirsutella minnesotensis 3608 TaxID=1043627 RepID=A0A0F7ZM88_9HYPO|nr:hypothetical protein HIM_08830 [Hirsutella minnesotensis 3608]